MSRDLVVGYCHPGAVSTCFLDSLLEVEANGGLESWIGVESGPRIATSRNNVVDQFLKRDAKYLLMADTDMSFSREQVNHLLDVMDDDHPIVGGLCFTGGEKVTPTLYALADDNGNFGMDAIWNYPPAALCEVDATGAAFLMVDRKVFEAMGDHYEGRTAYKWFSESERDGKEIGEDITFCLRARGLGFKVHVDTRVIVGHRKARILDQDAYLAWRRTLTPETV